jgi:hypothetical protein
MQTKLRKQGALVINLRLVKYLLSEECLVKWAGKSLKGLVGAYSGLMCFLFKSYKHRQGNYRSMMVLL